MWRLLTILAFLVGGCQHERTELTKSPPPVVTICAMVENPHGFQNDLVTLDAEVSSDGKHFTLLMDASSKCQRGVVLSWDDHAAPHGSDRILAAIWRPWPGTTNKKIQGRFTGILRHQERVDGLFPWMFVVSRIEDLEIAVGERPW